MENIMGKVYDFLQKCGVFYVLTLNGGRPEGRPFGAVMEAYGKLFFSTAKTKQVYKQLTHNPIIQIIALKPNTREWIRINGEAIECEDIILKEKMLTECPVLKKRFNSACCEFFALFEVSLQDAYINIDNEFVKINE
ncbi:MAG: pyridoxamine 5'-phosphate oxidase family protein [Candidatus Borkfalkia sp.]